MSVNERFVGEIINEFVSTLSEWLCRAKGTTPSALALFFFREINYSRVYNLKKISIIEILHRRRNGRYKWLASLGFFFVSFVASIAIGFTLSVAYVVWDIYFGQKPSPDNDYIGVIVIFAIFAIPALCTWIALCAWWIVIPPPNSSLTIKDNIN